MIGTKLLKITAIFLLAILMINCVVPVYAANASSTSNIFQILGEAFSSVIKIISNILRGLIPGGGGGSGRRWRWPEVAVAGGGGNKTLLGKFTITAYCPCSKCCGKTNGITASGKKATAGRTIAAPKTYAFGTKLEINGHTYVVEDRGGAIKGNRIDIFMNTHQEALNWGKKTLNVYKINS